jgi:RNA polymerase sigma factor (sigma-70 family)
VSTSERQRRFDALFASHGPDIVAYCRWRSATDAQDAAADVFLAAWRRLDEVPEGDAARVWLYATARRVLANQRRSSRRREALYGRLAAKEAARPAEQQLPEEALVHEALRLLPARDREVLLLAEWEGLSPAQIATVMGCARVTARGRLHRARRRFRAAFEELMEGQRRPRNIQISQRRSMSTPDTLETLRRANPRRIPTSRPPWTQSRRRSQATTRRR